MPIGARPAVYSVLDAEVTELEHRGQHKRMTWLTGRPPGGGSGPEAFYSETLGENATTRPHFHSVDQFQLFVEGGQRVGSTRIEPVVLHYADAFTPYGPIVGDDGVHYLTYRARADPGAFFMPESRPLRRERGGRHATVRVPLRTEIGEGWTPLIELHDDGLAASCCVLDPAASVRGCGPALGAGRAYVVARGSMHVSGRDHPVLSSLFVQPGDDVERLVAGSDGLVAVALGFPGIGAGGRSNAG